MAGRDYLMCEECGKRLAYDGDNSMRDTMDWEPIYCKDCYQKLLKEIKKLRCSEAGNTVVLNG